MRNVLLIALLIPTCLSLQSCFNYINLNEAQALGKGNSSVQFEAEGDFNFPSGDDIGGWGSLEGLYTYGATQKYDVGIILNTNTAIGIHNKYQLLDTEKNDVALGLDFKVIASSLESWELLPVLYYTRQIDKTKLFINPSVRYGYAFAETRKVFTPNITIGAQFGENPFRIGYNLSKSQFEQISVLHSIGITYNLNW